MQNDKRAVLALEDGSLFYGRSRSPEGIVCGEVVFNTSPTGYQEVCTDPSYANQIVLFTSSHIGNVGTNEGDNESSQTWVKGILVRELSKVSSSWRSKKDFSLFLEENAVPWIEGLDTRRLTRHLRQSGSQNGCLMVGEIDETLALKLALDFSAPSRLCASALKLAARGGFASHSKKIAVYDFGVKRSILNQLEELGYEVKLFPSTASANEILACKPDGIVLSNGPGDPAARTREIAEVRLLLESGIPLLGICLGCQLIALAAGGRTVKMKFGHHGTNHPVYDLNTKKVYITSQNHNYAVDEASLASHFEVTHRSLFDGTVQGIRSKTHPIIGFQGHPEGSPGPQDILRSSSFRLDPASGSSPWSACSLLPPLPASLLACLNDTFL